ncbi:hypothetical protein ACP275_13G036200 [Erythranthe tilingii]
MKFTKSPEIELSVHDTRLSIQQDNASMHVGTSVWPCSLVLVKFAERWDPLRCAAADNPYRDLLNFTGKRGIELGTGCGAAAMGLYLLGLHDVVLTDIAPVMPALKHNLKRNKSALKKTLKTAQLYWGNEEQLKSMKPPFDFVIAADVVYLEETVAPLIKAIDYLVAENGVVLLGYQLRSPEAHEMFWQMCPDFFEVEKIPHEHLHPDYAYEESDIYVFRKKKNTSQNS